MRRIAGRRLIEADDLERLEEQIDASRVARTTLAAMARLKPREQEALLLVGTEGLAPRRPRRCSGSAARRSGCGCARHAGARSGARCTKRRRLTGAARHSARHRRTARACVNPADLTELML
jgi:hypothetical protein